MERNLEVKVFEVQRASDNVTVFRGTLGPGSLHADTGDSVQISRSPTKCQLISRRARSWQELDVFDPARRVLAHLLSGNAGVLWTKLWHGSRSGARVSGVYTCRLPFEGRVSFLLGEARRARQYRRMARCRRLWPLVRELRHYDGHAAVDLGDLRVEGEEHQAEYSGGRKRDTGVNTGEYGDSSCSDARLWAAAEL